MSTQESSVQPAQEVAVKREPSASPRPQPSPPPSALQKEKPPGASVTRHRPRNLDVSLANNAVLPRSALTARDSTMGIQDLGLACISPGFQPQDAMMEEKVQRSVAVREQQRQLIESRLQETVTPRGAGGGADATGASAPSDSATRADQASSAMGNNGPATASVINRFDIFAPSNPGKRRPPPGLSIVPPSAQQFANDRVIQSAPLNQTFASRMGSSGGTAEYKGGRPNLPPTSFAPFGQFNAGAHNQAGLKSSPTPQKSRPLKQLSSTAGTDQRVSPGLPTRNNNRLPPLTDVIGSGDINVGANNNTSGHHRRSLSISGPGVGPGNDNNDRDNGLKSQQELSRYQRRREFRSAEEAVQELTSGREELLPRLVHYGGPSTPTERGQDEEMVISDNRNESMRHTRRGSTLTTGATTPTGLSRRRRRSEYEIENGSPPLGTGPEPRVPRYHHHYHNRIPSSHAQNFINAQQAHQQTRLPPTSISNGSRPIPRNHHHSQQHQGINAAESNNATTGSRPTNFEGLTGKIPTSAAAHMPSTAEEWRGTYDIHEAQQKKDEFLSLMSRAWDIFHS